MDLPGIYLKQKSKEKLLHILCFISFLPLLVAAVFIVFAIIKGSDMFSLIGMGAFAAGFPWMLFQMGAWDKTRKRNEVLKRISKKKSKNLKPMDQLLVSYIDRKLDSRIRSLPLERIRYTAELAGRNGTIDIRGRKGGRYVEIHFEETYLAYGSDEDEVEELTEIPYSDITKRIEDNKGFLETAFGILYAELSKI
jgi:hypothetical protein